MDDKIDEQIIIRMGDKVENLNNEVKVKHDDDPEVEIKKMLIRFLTIYHITMKRVYILL
jgi:hypothetical protein